MQNAENWKDSRYIAYNRQSLDPDGDGSVLAQLKTIRAVCDEDGMIFVDAVKLEGVTGSLPAKKEMYEKLIKRKLEKNDFDTIVIQRIDRATRSGGGFGLWLETELKMHGIRIRYVGEDIPTGRHSTLIKVVKYEAAKETGMSTSQRTAQGRQYAIEKGTLRTTGQTSYGCWRIYYTLNNNNKYEPAFIIRNCQNGLQEQLHPQTFEVIAVYGTIGEKSYGRFRKQKADYALLRPGDMDQIRIVRIIFFLWFRWGWKGKRIAHLLNKHGVPSPKGRKWSQRQVDSIVENKAYTGRTVNGASFSGIYNRAKKGVGFQALDRDDMELLTRKTMPVVYTPFEDHTEIEQPHMKDFLPPHIRRLAIAFHHKMALNKLDPMYGKKKQSKKNKFPNSDYWLSNLMVSKHDQVPYVGHLSGARGEEIQYYRRSDWQSGYQTGDPRRRLIPMVPLHTELCRILCECLTDIPHLKEKLTALLAEQRQYAEANDQTLDTVLKERDEIRERTLWISQLSKKAREDAAPELARLDRRRDELDALIEQRQANHRPINEPVEHVIERTLLRCQRLTDELKNLPAPTMRDIAATFFSKVECDGDTKNVEVSLALPKFVLEKRKKLAGANEIDQNDLLAMCVGRSGQSSIYSDTHNPNIAVAVVDCTHRNSRKRNAQDCYECRRRAA